LFFLPDFTGSEDHLSAPQCYSHYLLMHEGHVWRIFLLSSLLQFDSNSIEINLLVFAVCAVIIWMVGTRLSFYADAIADRTGLDSAFIGLLLLAGATSLPEIATTIASATLNNPSLAMNNILGGITFQTALLVVADLLYGRGPLTTFVPRSVMLLQGMALIMLLAFALLAIVSGEFLSLSNIGLWSFFLFLVYIAALYVTHKHKEDRWQPTGIPVENENSAKGAEQRAKRYADWSLLRIGSHFAVGSAVILAVGYLLGQISDVLAEQSGLGASFVGATLLAASTSLPELSTTIAAVRIRNYSLAIGNIFGSNSLMVALIFVADVFFRDGLIINSVDRSAMVSAAFGIVMTGIFVVGMIERRNRAVWRMGIDSWCAALCYVASIALLFLLRG
jgi:cation:H+ antiporter